MRNCEIENRIRTNAVKKWLTKEGLIFLEWLFSGLEYKQREMDKSLNPEKPATFWLGRGGRWRFNKMRKLFKENW